MSGGHGPKGSGHEGAGGSYNWSESGGSDAPHRWNYSERGPLGGGHGGGEGQGKGGKGCLYWVIGGVAALGVAAVAIAWNRDSIGGAITHAAGSEDGEEPGRAPATPPQTPPATEAPAEEPQPHVEGWHISGERLVEVVLSGLDRNAGPVQIAVVFETDENLFGEGKACNGIGACLLRDQAISEVAEHHGHTNTEAIVITVPADQIDDHGILRVAIPRTLEAGENTVDMNEGQSWIAVAQEPRNPQPGQEFRYDLEEVAPQGETRQMEFPNRSTW